MGQRLEFWIRRTQAGWHLRGCNQCVVQLLALRQDIQRLLQLALTQGKGRERRITQIVLSTTTNYPLLKKEPTDMLHTSTTLAIPSDP